MYFNWEASSWQWDGDTSDTLKWVFSLSDDLIQLELCQFRFILSLRTVHLKCQGGFYYASTQYYLLRYIMVVVLPKFLAKQSKLNPLIWCKIQLSDCIPMSGKKLYKTMGRYSTWFKWMDCYLAQQKPGNDRSLESGVLEQGNNENMQGRGSLRTRVKNICTSTRELFFCWFDWSKMYIFLSK